MNALTSLRRLIGRDPTIRPVERVAKRRLKVLHGGEFISYLDTTLGMTKVGGNSTRAESAFTRSVGYFRQQI